MLIPVQTWARCKTLEPGVMPNPTSLNTELQSSLGGSADAKPNGKHPVKPLVAELQIQ